VKFRNRSGENITILDHVVALLAEMDLRHQERFAEKDKRDEQRFAAQSEAVAAALLSQEKAVVKAETANEKRFESVNEFRKTLSDQTSSFPSRVELHALAERVTDLATRLDKSEGRSTGLGDGTKLLIQFAGLLIAAIGLYLALK
jgi:hypothetical protein